MATDPAQARLYLAGPMTGLPDLNRAAFESAGRRLRGVGFDVVSPADLLEWLDLRAALTLLLTADGVALLPGWRDSAAACLEADLAAKLGMVRLPVPGWLTAAGQGAYMGRLLADRVPE